MRFAWIGVLLAVALVTSVYGANFTASVSPSSFTYSSNTTLNFTINNTDALHNITNVSIVLPQGFSYVSNSNGTSASGSIFTLIHWSNSTIAGLVPNGTVANFWFNISNSSVAGSVIIILGATDSNSVTVEKNVTVTVTDSVLPSSTLVSPANNTSTSSSQVDFDCSATDVIALKNITLWGNLDGTWSQKGSRNVTGTSASVSFTYVNIGVGNYTWNCRSSDSSGNVAFASNNFTFTVTNSNASSTNLSVSFAPPTPANNSYINRNWMYINATTTLDVYNATLTVNSTNYTMNNVSNKTWHYNVTNLSHGANYTFRVWARSHNETVSTEERMVFVDMSSPFASILVTPTLNYANNPVTINCLASDSNLATVSINVTGPSNHSYSSIGSNFTVTLNGSGITQGQYTIKCIATDKAGNVFSTNRTFSALSSIGSNQFEAALTLVANNSTEITVSNSAIDVTKISVTPTSSASSSVRVTEFPDKPAGVVTAPGQLVYAYYEITLPGVSVRSAAIEFKVSKSWAVSNKVDLNSIKMYRFTGSWEALTTQKVREDSTDYYFTSNSPGFSYFAVGGSVQAQPQPVETENTSLGTKPEGKSSIGWIVLLVILILVGGIAFYLYQKGYLYMLEIPERRRYGNQ